MTSYDYDVWESDTDVHIRISTTGENRALADQMIAELEKRNQHPDGINNHDDD